MVERESTSQIQFQNDSGVGKGEGQGRNVFACPDLSELEPLNIDTGRNKFSLWGSHPMSTGDLKEGFSLGVCLVSSMMFLRHNCE